MKHLICFLIIAFIQHFEMKCQISIKKVKIYACEWNGHPPSPITCSNIKKRYNFYLETEPSKLNVMFSSYEDCHESLSQRKIYIENDTLKDIILSNALVEICFINGKIISVCFDDGGNYYFNGHWHERHDAFYHTLFKYFSELVISPSLFNETKKNQSQYAW